MDSVKAPQVQVAAGKAPPKRGRLCWDSAGGSPLLHDVVELVAGLVVLQPVYGAPLALPVRLPELPDKHLRGEGEAGGSAGEDEPRAAHWGFALL